MSKLSSLTNALTRSSDGQSNGLFNIHVPESSLGGILPVTKETDVTSLGELTSSLADTIGNLNQIAHMAYCLGEVITHPSSMLKILDNITNMLLAVALEMAERLASVLEGQILGMLGTTLGTAINLINSILDFMTAVLRLYETLKNAWENIKKRSLGNLKDFMSNEDCEWMFSYIAACLFNKLFGDKLAEFERKVTSKITEKGQSINRALSNELADVNTLGNYINHETSMINKANQQLSLFS